MGRPSHQGGFQSRLFSNDPYLIVAYFDAADHDFQPGFAGLCVAIGQSFVHQAGEGVDFLWRNGEGGAALVFDAFEG